MWTKQSRTILKIYLPGFRLIYTHICHVVGPPEKTASEKRIDPMPFHFLTGAFAPKVENG